MAKLRRWFRKLPRFHLHLQFVQSYGWSVDELDAAALWQVKQHREWLDAHPLNLSHDPSEAEQYAYHLGYQAALNDLIEELR